MFRGADRKFWEMRMNILTLRKIAKFEDNYWAISGLSRSYNL